MRSTNVLILSARDHDGYFIPVVVALTESRARLEWEAFRIFQVKNTYWDLSTPPMKTWLEIAVEEGK